MLHKGKHTTDEMLTPYKILTGQMDGEIADLKKREHHVDGWEYSIRKWLDIVDLDA